MPADPLMLLLLPLLLLLLLKAYPPTTPTWASVRCQGSGCPADGSAWAGVGAVQRDHALIRAVAVCKGDVRKALGGRAWRSAREGGGGGGVRDEQRRCGTAGCAAAACKRWLTFCMHATCSQADSAIAALKT